MDDAGKIEHEGSAEITMEAESESGSCKVDGICPEVIKVYIFKADPGEDDLGKRHLFENTPTWHLKFCMSLWFLSSGL